MNIKHVYWNIYIHTVEPRLCRLTFAETQPGNKKCR